ncbi:MAG: hypothetical protein HN348_23355, partial [Proteobacteria bacterium]|nr:hypothetical protein [Pseudomonadota bacterium]
MTQWSIPEQVSSGDCDRAVTTMSSNNLALAETRKGSVVYATWMENFCDSEADNATNEKSQRLLWRKKTSSRNRWNRIQELVNHGEEANTPKLVALPRGSLSLVWRDGRNDLDDPSKQELYFMESDDDGTTWGKEERLTPNRVICLPNMSVSEVELQGRRQKAIHLAYEDYSSPNNRSKVHYLSKVTGDWPTSAITVSGDLSVGEGAPFVLTGPEYHDVYVTYASHSYGGHNWEAMAREVGGLGSVMDLGTWEDIERVTDDPGDVRFPTSAIQGQYIHLVWADDRYDEGEYQDSADIYPTG